jgi:molecular chaperone DnaK (HSP70)
MAEKELFIQAVQMIEVDGAWNIPTAVLYDGDKVLVGNAALAGSSDYKLVNEDFKIDLGRYAPGAQSKRAYLTAGGRARSAVQIADDFLFEVQKIAKKWLNAHGINECKNVVIAEPLSMHAEDVSPEWLANYRATLRRLLEGKTILDQRGVAVRFIPEPFAAFQYYRHGLRHPLVSQRTQMNALVVDFGGGTCDVCIIQTTKEGDVSGGGQNKRPLAGKSLPVGGYSINRAVAEYLLRKIVDPSSHRVKIALREYKEWCDGKRSTDAIDRSYQAFIENFHRLVHRVETLKLSLSKGATDWSLTADQRFSASITIPSDPFVEASKPATVAMSVSELRDVFINKVYLPSLKPFFESRLRAGCAILENSTITVALLSGGSANLGWLQRLLVQDFPEQLHGVPFVQIPDYQQVVAQGLAIDCAREFISGNSDFRGVTYNPLFLLLNPDESECDPRPFITQTPGLPDVKQRPGLILPTASVVTSFLEQPMEWRVRLNRPPRRKMEYYFLQSSMDVSDIKNLQNVEETVLHTTSKVDFDSSLQVRLTIRPDGTATPQFIYQAATPNHPERMKEGRKFALDMTDTGAIGGEAYLGIDFGTSNTAVSYVDRSWVQVIESRSSNSQWRELGELVDLLPSPLAVPLAHYIGDLQSSSQVPPGFSFIDAALCLMAYISLAEYYSNPRRGTTRIFKQFPHRSATASWLLLSSLQEQMGKSAEVTAPFKALFGASNRALLDRVTRGWAEVRHELSHTSNDDILSAVRLLSNTCNAVFAKYRFGYMDSIQKERFSKNYTGRFRIAHGKPPFTEHLSYSGSQSFSEAEALLINPETGDGLLLTPFVLWYPCKAHPDSDNGHCYVFDKLKGEGEHTAAVFKASSTPCQISTDVAADTGSLLEQLLQFKREDGSLLRLEGLGVLSRIRMEAD